MSRTMKEHLVDVHGNPEWYVRQRPRNELVSMHVADHATRFSMGRLKPHRRHDRGFAALEPYE